MPPTSLIGQSMFQSTHPHGVRLKGAGYTTPYYLFQSTHPHGVRHERQTRTSYLCLFQSTHPHGVRQDGIKQINPSRVSIHAPTRGATVCRLILKSNNYVSIHAPTRGATWFAVERRGDTMGFQSTHPHGVRHPKHTKDDRRFGFNPRTHTGCDYQFKHDVTRITKFQSTHPHGVRPHVLRSPKSRIRGFNPRTHTGCDMMLGAHWYNQRVSIHAPTRGATMGDVYARESVPVSIHAPTRGATQRPLSWAKSVVSFNPRTHTGCDITKTYWLSAYYVSIHAPTRGATCHCICNSHSCAVSIHAPTRGATDQHVHQPT